MVDLAVEGRTDEQIAQCLDLSVSTINSYWVRIRGKLGPHARVEIVADLIRHQARLKQAALTAENQRLRDELEETKLQYEKLCVIQAAHQQEAPHLMALYHAPEAILVTAAPSNVVFANQQAWRIYGARPGELEGVPMRELTTSATPETLREPCRPLFEPDGPERETVGIHEPYFARRRDGSNFRAVLQAERFTGPKGPLAVVSVREFLSEAHTIFQALRQPLSPPTDARTPDVL